MKNKLKPKLFTLLKTGIPRKQIIKDILAGVTVGIVALPLAIAFAIASGVSPEKGLITAIVAGLIISIFGGSRVQIGGPTGAFIIVVYGIVQEFGIEGLTIATLMAGVIIVILGLARFGNYLKFIPYPLIVGFTSGIAIIIFNSQIKEILGLQITELPAGILEQWILYGQSLHQVNPFAVGIAAFTLVLTVLFKKVTPNIPGSVIAIVACTLVVQLLHLPVDTIESAFGDIPNRLTLPSFPVVDFATIKLLVQPAIAIALLGSIESLLSATVADGMIGGRHRSNIELVAQGGANIFSALFGGIPATGAIARTATNVKNGGRTPLAGIVHSIVLLLITLFFAPYAKLIPLSCLAGILTVVAYNMSEWRQFRSMLKGGGMDVAVLLSTFFLTVVFDLVIAIQAGVVLSSFLFMKRMSESLQIEAVPVDDEENELLFQDELPLSSKDIMIYEINGPLFFGAAQQFQDTLLDTNTRPKVIILRMRYVPLIDATGYLRLKEIIRLFQKKNVPIVLSGVSPFLLEDFEKNNMFETINRELVFRDIQLAVKSAGLIASEIDRK